MKCLVRLHCGAIELILKDVKIKDRYHFFYLRNNILYCETTILKHVSTTDKFIL